MLYPEQCLCKSYLTERVKRHNVSEVPVSLNGSFFELSADIAFRTASNALNSRLTSAECKDKFLSFLCADYIVPCDLDNPSAMAIRPTASECKEIRDDICFAEWKLLELSMYGSLLPNCSDFDDDDDMDFRPDQVCNDQFKLYCDSLCLPLCKEFSQNSEGLTLLQDILFIFAAVSSLIGGTIVIIIAIYRRNSM